MSFDSLSLGHKLLTCILEKSRSLIDHIVTSNINLISIIDQCVFSGISNHNLIYTFLNLKIENPKQGIIKYRDFKNIDANKSFQNELKNLPFHILDTFDDINDQIYFFEKIFNSLMDCHFPEKSFTPKKKRQPWINNDLLKLFKIRDYLKHRYQKYPTEIAWLSYKIVRNKAARLNRDTKRTFINSNLLENIKNNKSFYILLRKYGIIKCKDNISYSFDKNQLDILNEHYQQVGNKLSDSNSDSPKHTEFRFDDDIVKLGNSFKFIPVTFEKLKIYLDEIKTKAKGIDMINIDYLKLSINTTLPIICKMINKSYIDGVFPDHWKLAQIRPLPKITNPKENSDFRPISILPTISKFIEKDIHHQLTDFFNSNKIIPEQQSGFRKHHSTTTLLIKVVNDIYEALDNNEIVSLVMIDMSKAFDSVNHKLLLSKFKSLGFKDNTLNLLTSYFENRKQQTISNENFSDWLDSISGVPQGSVLGPLFYCFATNDLPLIFKHSKCETFADDTQDYKSYKLEDANIAIDHMNEDLDRLSSYCKKNNLTINPKKCFHLIIGSASNLTKLSKKNIPDLKINNTIIPKCTTVRNLGIIFDQYFTWEKHVNFIIKSCFITLKPLFRSKKFLTQEIRIKIIQSLIMPKFDYCDIVYMHLSTKLQNKLQKMHNLCIRFIFNLKKFDHISNYFKQLNYLDLAKRRLLHLGCLLFKLNINDTPKYLKDMITNTNEIHNYNTRSRNYIPNINKSSGQKMFKFYAPKFWNNIPTTIKNASNICEFKQMYKAYLINDN